MLFIFLLVATVPILDGLMTTICDCTSKPEKHFLMFQDSNCNVKQIIPPRIAVNYTVYSKSRGAIKIPAAVCPTGNCAKR